MPSKNPAEPTSTPHIQLPQEKAAPGSEIPLQEAAQGSGAAFGLPLAPGGGTFGKKGGGTGVQGGCGSPARQAGGPGTPLPYRQQHREPLEGSSGSQMRQT